MTLLAKRNLKLTQADLNALYKAIGTPEMPYPSSKYVIDKTDGVEKLVMGVIADPKTPLPIYSERPTDYVLGRMYREMPIPSLQRVLVESLLRRAPSSHKRLLAVFGKAGSGKTTMVEQIATMCDERGPLIVDCGGRYMSDLLWEQVIDYGSDYKTALNERINAGKLTENSKNVLEEAAGDALTKDDTGNIVGINWIRQRSIALLA